MRPNAEALRHGDEQGRTAILGKYLPVGLFADLPHLAGAQLNGACSAPCRRSAAQVSWR